MKVTIIWLLLLLACNFPGFPISSCKGNQIENLNRLIESRKSSNPPRPELWVQLDNEGRLGDNHNSPVYVGSQKGLMQADKINKLPGQPEGVDFDQYAGYVTVDPVAARALFYYFVESPVDSVKKPLVLWLNGGPGCSSFGYGAMQELGPFRVNSDGKTLYRNEYAWNNVANVLFLESPAGVGFSYSNASDYFKVGDKKTAEDSYIFLLNWLERFPQYKTRDFYITGESYAGHYVPQLARYILSKNKNANQTVINLKGIAIGNAWIDDAICSKGLFDFLWTHALNSDETNQGINKYCNFASDDSTKPNGQENESQCDKYQIQGFKEMGYIDLYGIYAPLCDSSAIKPGPIDNVKNFDPCSSVHVASYLNLATVQAALRAKPTKWSGCSDFEWTDSPTSILPEIQSLAREIRVWIYRYGLEKLPNLRFLNKYSTRARKDLNTAMDKIFIVLKINPAFSGDTDGRVPVTSSRYAIKTLELPIETAWRPWYSNSEVGGYVVGYKGVTFATVRGAGHTVPSFEPERALTMITSFLQGKLPPASRP